MRSPEHEREELLAVAIRAATEALGAPIDRVEVADGVVRCRAGDRTVALGYGRPDGQGPDAAWVVRPVEDPAERRPEVVGRAVAKFLKKRGW